MFLKARSGVSSSEQWEAGAEQGRPTRTWLFEAMCMLATLRSAGLSRTFARPDSGRARLPILADGFAIVRQGCRCRAGGNTRLCVTMTMRMRTPMQGEKWNKTFKRHRRPSPRRRA